MARKTLKSIPCDDCKALCCRHVALPIDKPKTAGDFDDIRWYIAHKKVSVFVEDGDWYVCFKSQCNYLNDETRCDLYDRRPRICRHYKTRDCEFVGDGELYDLQFTKPRQIERYAKEFLKKKKKRRSKKDKKK